MAAKPWPDRIVDGAAGHFIKSGKTAARAIFNVIATDVAVYCHFYGGDVCRTLVANGAIPHSWFVVSTGLMLMGLLMLVARDFSLLQKFSR